MAAIFRIAALVFHAHGVLPVFSDAVASSYPQEVVPSGAAGGLNGGSQRTSHYPTSAAAETGNESAADATKPVGQCRCGPDGERGQHRAVKCQSDGIGKQRKLEPDCGHNSDAEQHLVDDTDVPGSECTFKPADVEFSLLC